MCRSRLVFLCVVAALALLGAEAGAVPSEMSFQGVLTDGAGVGLPDGNYSVTFAIFPDSIAGAVLWQEGQLVTVQGSLFDVFLGSVNPIPDSVFTGSTRWLSLRVGLNPEVLPRTRLSTVPYAWKAHAADAVDTAMFAHLAQEVVEAPLVYHGIVDVEPAGTLTVPFLTLRDAASVKLYLHGQGSSGFLSGHTHEGNNAHAHGFSGTVDAGTAPHTHTVSGSTASDGSAHTHSATTNTADLTHSHGLSINSHNLAHSHGGATSSYPHRHNLIVDGFPGSGNYLVHTGDGNALSASDTPDRTLVGSIDVDVHSHVINSDLSSNVTHSGSIGNALGTHNHTLTTGNGSVSHSHTFNVASGSHSVSHSHTMSGSVGSAGSGLLASGVAVGTLPSSVYIYVDGNSVAGPFSGAFSTGEIDLTTLFTTAGEHVIEIRETGGNGGRVAYNLLVK